MDERKSKVFWKAVEFPAEPEPSHNIVSEEEAVITEEKGNG